MAWVAWMGADGRKGQLHGPCTGAGRGRRWGGPGWWAATRRGSSSGTRGPMAVERGQPHHPPLGGTAIWRPSMPSKRRARTHHAPPSPAVLARRYSVYARTRLRQTVSVHSGCAAPGWVMVSDFCAVPCVLDVVAHHPAAPARFWLPSSELTYRVHPALPPLHDGLNEYATQPPFGSAALHASAHPPSPPVKGHVHSVFGAVPFWSRHSPSPTSTQTSGGQIQKRRLGVIDR